MTLTRQPQCCGGACLPSGEVCSLLLQGLCRHAPALPHPECHTDALLCSHCVPGKPAKSRFQQHARERHTLVRTVSHSLQKPAGVVRTDAESAHQESTLTLGHKGFQACPADERRPGRPPAAAQLLPAAAPLTAPAAASHRRRPPAGQSSTTSQDRHHRDAGSSCTVTACGASG